MIDLHDYFELDEDFIVRWKRARGNSNEGTEVGNTVTLGGTRFQRSALFLVLASTSAKSDSGTNTNTDLEDEMSAHIGGLEDTVRLQNIKLTQLERYLKEMQRTITIGR